MAADGRIVGGFNFVAGFVHDKIASKIPGKEVLGGTISFLSETLPADGLKTLVVKPLILAYQVLKKYGYEERFPLFKQLGFENSATKALISALEVITKLPKMLKSISNPIEDEKRSKRVWRNENGVQRGLTWSKTEVVFHKIFNVSGWAIAVGDAISFANSYRRLPAILNKATPWIYTVAGGYMAVSSLYNEVRYTKETWGKESAKAVPAEKYYGLLNYLTYGSYLAYSIIGGLGLYFKDQKPSWLGKYQFAASVGVTLLPAVQKCATAYMKKTAWA